MGHDVSPVLIGGIANFNGESNVQARCVVNKFARGKICTMMEPASACRTAGDYSAT